MSLFRLRHHNTPTPRHFEIIECHPLPVILFIEAPGLSSRKMPTFTADKAIFRIYDSSQFLYEFTRQANRFRTILISLCSEARVGIASNHLGDFPSLQ